MLIALELAGFKSFAERTRFDFPDGITVIVGPNGSGKSNVVDAIKWVLGAQGAKAMRGKDMTDVIFKGSSGSGRKPAGSAEATLVFDNRSNTLPVETEEVQVTRRVYRSGEGEYLINGQACRLKDIKDLFRGTGVGVDAYSLIEQGKVDRMLQASPKDRRIIFEEAAGISRFNAKKVEAQRRIARVDQNLVRLKDIVDEVGKRLNSLKSQASKAQRYREMTVRLQEVRLHLGHAEYQELQDKLADAKQKLEALSEELSKSSGEVEQSQSESQQAELNLHEIASQCQEVEASLQEKQKRIAVGKNQLETLDGRVKESDEEAEQRQARLQELQARAEGLQAEIIEAKTQVEDARLAYEQSKSQVSSAAEKTSAAQKALEEKQQRELAIDEALEEHFRQITAKGELAEKQRRNLADLDDRIARTERLLKENQSTEEAARKAAELAATRLKQIHEQKQVAADKLTETRAQVEENKTALSDSQEQAAVFQGRLEGAASRLQILEQLEQHLEGVDAGARHILRLKEQAEDSVYSTVKGLVAELIQVDVELAPLIDTALGPTANALVLTDGQLYKRATAGQLEVPGRLSMLRLDRLPTRRYGEKVQLDGVSGVMGRADRLINVADSSVEPLYRYLLGTTWLVENLETALELGHFRGAGLRFVTAACDLVEPDGSLTLGSLHVNSGLVSRRSEISNAKQEIQDCRLQYQRLKGEIERSNVRVEKLQPLLAQCEAETQELTQEFAHQQANAQAAVGKLDDLETQSLKLQKELEEYRAERQRIAPAIEKLRQEIDSFKAEVEALKQESAGLAEVLAKAHTQLTSSREAESAHQIDLARTEQKLESSLATLKRATEAQAERSQAISEAEQEVQRLLRRKAEANQEITSLRAQLEDDESKCQSEQTKLTSLAEKAAALRESYNAASKRYESSKRSFERAQQQQQTLSVEIDRCEEAIESLVKRYTEDYQISLDDLLSVEPVEEADDRKAMEKEASKLRGDIASVGEINMSALAELDELQQRYDHLSGQYEDLQAAKESLQRIIQKINHDSRRLFMETLEAIRKNFQVLYRKSFGGGQADIVLEEGVDVLECGIDIVATPPGKTALSNSLLSGGEKALTAVALLLAIFQYRPSPFCVLDEVDAPFDEANIGRFVSVLTEFLDWTKFIIVTHSKKTMTASTTLYGVTMQESGVSKQVAVRFEDVNEKGEIIKPKSPQAARKAA